MKLDQEQAKVMNELREEEIRRRTQEWKESVRRATGSELAYLTRPVPTTPERVRSSGGAEEETSSFMIPEMVRTYISESEQGEGTSSSTMKPRINMIRCSQAAGTIDEEELRRALRPPITPRTENEEQNEAQINQNP